MFVAAILPGPDPFAKISPQGVHHGEEERICPMLIRTGHHRNLSPGIVIKVDIVGHDWDVRGMRSFSGRPATEHTYGKTACRRHAESAQDLRQTVNCTTETYLSEIHAGRIWTYDGNRYWNTNYKTELRGVWLRKNRHLRQAQRSTSGMMLS